ncbi:methyltransferase, FkbM family [Rhizobium sp. RU35A]|uniref:FkbM family methyltransferase n=1 Tax=Rhizobium sp. RU35A TaxID=1907414 RepID=UPI0009546989|nr:FkbM family methyltransferase [Rhizobium sp. RU35A]SIQ99140.1 methyltransferase, FkbM family [Rhizobium sp. RU35A]
MHVALSILPKFAPLRQLRGWMRFCLILNSPDRNPHQNIRVRRSRGTVDLDPGSYVEWNVLLFRDYEGEEKRLFCQLAESRGRAGLVLDVGANVGMHSLTFGEHFDRVFAFEPNPAVYERLVRNVETGADGNITTFNIGLSDRDDILLFYQPTHANQGTGTFDPSFKVDGAREVCLPVRIGDEILREQGLAARVDAVKIDVQGFEPQVLSGLRQSLQASRPLIWFEVSDSTIARFSDYGGLISVIPFPFTLFRFHTRLVAGLVYRTDLVSCGINEPLVNADYVVVPTD